MTVTITFLLRAGLRRPDADATLAAVCRLPGVQRAGRVSPRGRHPLARRMCYVELAEEESPDDVRAAVEGVPGVESASLPPVRRAL